MVLPDQRGLAGLADDEGAVGGPPVAQPSSGHEHAGVVAGCAASSWAAAVSWSMTRSEAGA